MWHLPVPVLLYLLAIMIPVHFYAGPLYMTTLRVIVLVMVIPLSINLVMGKYGRLLWTDLLFFLHVAWSAVSLGVNNPNMAVTQVGSVGTEFLGGYLLARAYIRTPDAFAALIRLMLLMVCLTLPFAIHETMTGRPIIIETLRKIPGITSESIVFIYKRWGLERTQVMMAHPIHYGLFCSVAFSLAFVGFKDIMNDVLRYLAAGVVCACVFFSLSSGALISVILQAGLIFYAWSFDKVRNRWMILFWMCVAAYVIVDLLSDRTPFKVFMHYATFSAHNAYWRGIIFEWGMKNVWANPILGLGLNSWVRPHFMGSGTMDNFWLLMAVRYGIPGFALLAVGYLLAMWQIGRRNFEGDLLLSQFRRAWMFTFVGLTFTLATVHVWSTVYSFTFFVFGAGMWFINAEPRGSAEPVAAGGRARRGPTSTRFADAGGTIPQTRGQMPARAPKPMPTTIRGPRQSAPETRSGQGQRYTRFPPGGPRRNGPQVG